MMIIAILILLIIAAIWDFKTLEVPLWITPAAIILRITDFALHAHQEQFSKETFIECIICAAFLFVLFFLAAYFTDMGGADCLIATVIGLSFGICGVYGVLLGFIYTLPYTIRMKIKKEKKPYPFVPYLVAGLFTVLIVLRITGYSLSLF